MSDKLDLIAATLQAVNDASVVGCNSNAVLATPEIFTTGKVATSGDINQELLSKFILACQGEVVTPEGTVIAGAAQRLKKHSFIVHTVKDSGSTTGANILVYFKTKQGIIVIWKHRTMASVIRDSITWGIPEKVKEVEKVVEKEVTKEVPAPLPSGFFQRLKLLFG